MSHSAMDVDSTPKIDEALYSRQLYVLGHEAMLQMLSSSVLIVGLKGLGVEIAKNLILGGVRVTLYDPSAVHISDLGSQFYFRESAVGHPRASTCVDALADLNRNVKVELLDTSLEESLLAKRFQLVVVTDRTITEQIKINEMCRNSNIGFIAADIRGVAARVFVDLGHSFQVSDDTGENPVSKLIASISQDPAGIVTVLDESRHGLVTGDFVTFEEVEGMHVLNNSPPRPVRDIGPYSFTIEDTSCYPAYKCGGRFRQVKMPVTVSFKPLAEQMIQPTLLDAPDMFKCDMPAQLHCFWQALSQFQDLHDGRLPRPDVMADAQRVVDFTKELAHSSPLNPTINEAVLLRLARCASASISPMAAMLGGVVGQEVMKAVSGKFMPIRQFWYFDALECLPTDVPLASYAPLNCRYDDYIAVFGRQLQSHVQQMSFFLVGAGAIGCEMLKNWAMMGIATEGKGQITLTDMDTIEKSNLSRQFLFRNMDVGQLKSATAERAIKAMNPSIRVASQANRVAPESQDVYDDAFWDSLDGVCTALDNVDARLYVDQRCIYYQKPLLESGTLGTKGNTQVCVPFLTQSYGATQDPPEQSIPICTLKNYPYQIEHTIQWARDMFEGWFKISPSEVNAYITEASYLKDIAKQPNTQLESLRTVKAMLVDERPLTFEACIQWARLKFEEEFNHRFQQLLYNFPADMITPQGSRFWSGTKRAPYPLEFSVRDPLHLGFIIAAANLRAQLYGLTGHRREEVFAAVLETCTVPSFQPKQGLKIAADEAEAKAMAANSNVDELDAQVSRIVPSLPTPASLAGFHLFPLEFEKDNDANFHVDFITTCSNLRARGYRIKEENSYQTKLIAGKIIPAIATTTAFVTGLISLELYKVAQRLPFEAYRCAFANLALPLFSVAEPEPPVKKVSIVKGSKWEWSLWDRLDIDGTQLSLQQLLDHFQEKYGLTINMLSYGAAIVYSFFANKKDLAQRLPLPIAEVCARVSKTEISPKTRYIVLEACVNDDDDNEIEIPYLRVKIQE